MTLSSPGLPVAAPSGLYVLLLFLLYIFILKVNIEVWVILTATACNILLVSFKVNFCR